MATHYSPKIVTDGLVLCLDAGDKNSYPGSGTTWTDLSGNGKNGTLTDGPTFSSADGGSIVFDGTDDVVELGSDGASIVNGLTDLTLEMWFKADATGNDDGLIFGSTTSNGKDSGVCLRFDVSGAGGGGTTNVIKTGFGENDVSPTDTALESSANLQSTDWTCIAVTVDVGTSITLYKNGSQDTQTYSVIGSVSSVSSCDGLDIGRGSKATLWDGKISIVRIYNRVLTASEVKQNFNAHQHRFGV